MSVTLGAWETVTPEPGAVFIADVRALIIGDKELEKQSGGGADCHAQASGHWIVDTPIANPMSRYPKYKASRTTWGIGAIGTMIVEVELSNGMVGVGISIGGPPGCYIVEHHLRRFIVGQDPRNVELIWDQMWRSTINYGRKGLPIQAISAVDLAIWDALGKLRGEPVYMLLGGKSKQRLPIYATTDRPDLAKKMGFHGAKFPCPYGPGDGEEGMRRNLQRFKEVRESVGPDFPLMLDCYMALTEQYTIDMVRRAKKYKIKWFEECLPPDNYEGYRRLKEKCNTLITTGEHEYTRYGYKLLLEKGCCDVIQPDITWCGGITEARRVVALASAYDIPVVPHGSSVYSYHLQIAYPSCPMAEFLIMSPNADKIVPYFGDLFIDEPLPKDGYVELDPKKPGFGITLNRNLNFKRPYNTSIVGKKAKM